MNKNLWSCLHLAWIKIKKPVMLFIFNEFL